ncbi:NAD(P)-dependent oxidoreductase [Isoptericola luteus]
MAGSAIVTEALTRGHHVVALARRMPDRPGHPRLTACTIDVVRTCELASALAATDAAVLTIRLAPGEEHRLAPLTRRVLDTAERTATRVLIVGGSAPLRSPTDPDLRLIEDPRHVPPTWRTIAQASLDQLHACQEHPYTRWTYLSPPAVFEPGTGTGRYRRGTTTLLTDRDGRSRITAPDLALAALDELEDPSNEHHFTVAEPSTSSTAEGEVRETVTTDRC